LRLHARHKRSQKDGCAQGQNNVAAMRVGHENLGSSLNRYGQQRAHGAAEQFMSGSAEMKVYKIVHNPKI
jgi:hypothetical protein